MASSRMLKEWLAFAFHLCTRLCCARDGKAEFTLTGFCLSILGARGFVHSMQELYHCAPAQAKAKKCVHSIPDGLRGTQLKMFPKDYVYVTEGSLWRCQEPQK